MNPDSQRAGNCRCAPLSLSLWVESFKRVAPQSVMSQQVFSIKMLQSHHIVSSLKQKWGNVWLLQYLTFSGKICRSVKQTDVEMADKLLVLAVQCRWNPLLAPTQFS